MISSGELLTKTRSGRTFSSPYAGPEHAEESVVIPSLNKAADQNGQIVSSQQKTSVWAKMDPCRISDLPDVALAVQTTVSQALPNEIIINTDMPAVNGSTSAYLLSRTKKRQKEKADKNRKRLKSESRGFSADNPMEFSSGHCTKVEDTMGGCEVVKFGATTGITRGLIAHNCLHAKRSDVKDLAFKDVMYNQIEITPLQRPDGFAKKGDSGAIVFMANRGNRNELAAVGMVVGGTTSNATVITPILDILKALGLKNLSFKTFDPCPRPRQLLSLEDLKKGQEKQSQQIIDQERRLQQQIIDQEKRLQQQISRMENEIKNDIAKTHEMIERLSEQIQARR